MHYVYEPPTKYRANGRYRMAFGTPRRGLVPDPRRPDAWCKPEELAPEEPEEPEELNDDESRETRGQRVAAGGGRYVDSDSDPALRKYVLAAAGAVVRVLQAHTEGLTLRSLRKLVRADLGKVWDGSTDAAIVHLGPALRRESAPRGAYRFTLSGAPLPKDVETGKPIADRENSAIQA
jgi:hypothetical protein